MKIYTITLTRKQTGTGVTEVFGDGIEAMQYFKNAAQLNKITYKNQNQKLDHDLVQYLSGENRVSILTMNIYTIKAKNRWKPKF